jgi:hypothetical protein
VHTDRSGEGSSEHHIISPVKPSLYIYTTKLYLLSTPL